MPKTVVKAVRVPEGVWAKAKERAEADETTVNAVLVAALRRYVSSSRD